MVPVDPSGFYDRSPRDADPVASSRLSLLLALEVAFKGRAAGFEKRLEKLERPKKQTAR